MKFLVVFSILLTIGAAKPPPEVKATELPPIAPRSMGKSTGLLPIAPRTTLACDSTVSLTPGVHTIQSINHPDNYINDHDCSYQLSSSNGQPIQLSCSEFNIEAHSSCGWDWLSVNGQKYCGTDAPSGSYDSLTIEFHTDYSVVRPGFSCSLTVPEVGTQLQCSTDSQTLSAGTYTIQSINHPDNYINNHDCSYQLSSSNGQPIQLSCSAFDIEAHSSCGWDWLSVNGQKYCGTDGPSGSYDSLTIEFHTDYSVVKPGFSCSLTVGGTGPSELQCSPDSQTLSVGTYTIQSINHPNNYENHQDCSYELAAESSDQTISISCSAFDLEAHSSCSWDWLSVNEQKYCGTSGPETSSTGQMSIAFHSDYSVVRPGFLCSVVVAEGGGSTTGTTSTTASPPGSCCCGMPNRATRIVGGEETEVNEYPWQVGLVSTGGTRTWCGGTLINNRYVLSAAHCTQNSASSIEVLLKEHRIGTSDGEIRASVSQIINHPSYTSASGSGYDFSLLKLSEPVTFPADNTLAPACLPSASSGDFTGVDAIVSGWGTTSSGGSQATTLQEVTVPVISNADCRNSYSSINPTMICAGLPQGGKDSCQGDSGGPMVTLESDRYSLIGVVSWGRGCALAGYPGVYARVTSVLDWIQQNTADGTYCS